jgi:hypothetical protein
MAERHLVSAYNKAPLWRRCLKLAGPRHTVIEGVWGGRYDWRVTVRPVSWLRFVPLAGQIWIYRLGAMVSFRCTIECIAVHDETDEIVDPSGWVEEGQEAQVNLSAALLLGGESHGGTSWNFLVTELCDKGAKDDCTMGPYFLSETGDARINGRIWGLHEPLYAFQVHEPKLTFATWTIALIAGAAGSLLIYLAKSLFGGSGAPPPQ